MGQKWKKIVKIECTSIKKRKIHCKKNRTTSVNFTYVLDFSPLLKVLGGPDSSLWSDKWFYQWLCGIFQCLENLSLSMIFASSAALPWRMMCPRLDLRFRFGSQNLKFFQKFEHIICGLCKTEFDFFWCYNNPSKFFL